MPVDAVDAGHGLDADPPTGVGGGGGVDLLRDEGGVPVGLDSVRTLGHRRAVFGVAGVVDGGRRLLDGRGGGGKVDGRPRFGSASLTRWASSINQIHTPGGFPAPGRSEVVRRALAGVCAVPARPRRNDRLARQADTASQTTTACASTSSSPSSPATTRHPDSVPTARRRLAWDWAAANQRKMDAVQQLEPLADALDDIETRIAELVAKTKELELGQLPRTLKYRSLR